MDLRLKDRVAFLTGATNEIGRAVCLDLVKEGGFVITQSQTASVGERIQTLSDRISTLE